MGVSAVVGVGRLGHRGGEVEISGGVVWRGDKIQGGIGAGRDARTGMRAGRTKLAT